MTKRYLPTEGISIASLVAKGTRNNHWQGAGAGMGSGGVVVGGGLGTSISRSELVNRLDVLGKAPAQRPNDYTLLAIPLFCVFLMLLLVGIIQDETAQLWVGSVIALLGAAGTLLYALFFAKKVKQEIDAENKRLQHEFLVRKAIYHRLRFVEADFVVFDPLTGLWAYAEKHNITYLLTKLTRQEVKESV